MFRIGRCQRVVGSVTRSMLFYSCFGVFIFENRVIDLYFRTIHDIRLYRIEKKKNDMTDGFIPYTYGFITNNGSLNTIKVLVIKFDRYYYSTHVL